MYVPFRHLTATLALFIYGSVPLVRADDAGCDPPPEYGPSEVTPADRATGVPRNAVIRVRYSPEYFAGVVIPTESVSLTSTAGSVAGRLELAGTDTLYFVPTAPLSASTMYSGEATGAAFPFEFSFTTGSVTDVARPDFADPTTSSAFALTASPTDSCGGGVGARRVRLSFPAAQDDGPSSSVEYWVYLTRAESLDAPVLLTRIRDYGTPTVTAGFSLSAAQAVSAACVSVVAVDGLDRATEWPNAVCLDPTGRVGFVGLCAVSSRAGGQGTAFFLAGISALLAVRQRRRVLR